MSFDSPIVIQGARSHNLKNISLSLPRNRLIVITGLSGSGKSSLAFDTLYAEGQRRYVESLSAYARQFLEQMSKPDVDSIEGLSPAISIEQKSAGRNPRSTVATVTEIYDHLRLLWARIGVPHCYKCGRPVRPYTVQQMADQILRWPVGTRFSIYAPVVRARKGEFKKELERLLAQGHIRVRLDGKALDLSEAIPALNKKQAHTIEVLLDRLVVKEGISARLAESLELALKLGEGLVLAETAEGEKQVLSEKAGCPDCGVSLPELEPRLFSFNNPFGACPECHGLGVKMYFDPELIVPDESLSLSDGAVAPWNSPTGFIYRMFLEGIAKAFGATMQTPYKALPPEAKDAILHGTEHAIRFSHAGRNRAFRFEKPFEGVIPSLERRYHDTNSEMIREELERYMSYTHCPACEGRRLKPEVLAITVDGRSIIELTGLSVAEALGFVTNLTLNERENLIAARILKELRARLGFLVSVGLDYLTLDRTAATLSGGESQRIRLATQIGSALVGVMYILDEPSIGLHQRDNERLLGTLKHLRDQGNTVIVVEHDEDTIRTADHIVDMGPGAGALGGEVVAQGNLAAIESCSRSLTGRYLKGELEIPVPPKRRPASLRLLTLKGCRANNLKNITVSFPLGHFICVTGVSGSGKSSLIIDTLQPTLERSLARKKPGTAIDGVSGVDYIDKVIAIDQSPIGRTPRSNPATYTQLFSPIRDLFAALPEARARGYKPGRFSFNVKGGRCEACEGAGVNCIAMHFLPDVYVTCEQCGGKRYNRETLDVRFKGKSISDVLDMTVAEAYELFANIPVVANKLKLLVDVGLGYIQTGQAATTLSGGEAQRIKLAKELARRSTGRTLYILDEPTTGLHFHDIRQLLNVLDRLVEGGNTVIVIEHNLDVIKTADTVIDLGPEGGSRGGQLLGVGTPEELTKNPASHTGAFLKTLLSRSR